MSQTHHASEILEINGAWAALTIHQAVAKLIPAISTNQPLTITQAIAPVKLTRIFVKSLKDWPRENAKDLVDSAYRAALVGVAAVVLPMLGVPVTVATGVGVVLFGGKKVSDGIRAVKDLT